MPHNEFYTYLHYRGDGSGVPFYCGKGSLDRAYEKSGRNPFWQRACKKYGMVVEIAARFRLEQDAFEHEVFLISTFRAMGIKLTNMTDGGEGASGHIRSASSRSKQSATLAEPEVKARQSEIALRQWKDPAFIAEQHRRYASVEHRAKISSGQRESWSKEESRARRSEALAAPAVRAKKSVSMRANWERNREALISAMRKAAADRPPKPRTQKTPKAPRIPKPQRSAPPPRPPVDRRAQQLALWQRPEHREKMLEIRGSEEFRAKAKQAQSATAPSKSRPVFCLELQRDFPSTRAAALELGLQQSAVSAVCRGRCHQTGGYHFRFVTPATEPPSPKP